MPTSPICGPPSSPPARSRSWPGARCSRCRGPRRSRSWRGWRRPRPGSRSCRPPRWRSPACPLGSRAPATPARTASRSRSPRPGAEALARRLLDAARGGAGRSRRARFAAPGGRALPLWPRAVDPRPARSRRGSPGRSASAGAPKAAFRAPRSSSRSWPRARAQAGRAPPRRPGAGARGHRDPGCRRPADRRGHERRLRADRRRPDRLGYVASAQPRPTPPLQLAGPRPAAPGPRR